MAPRPDHEARITAIEAALAGRGDGIRVRRLAVVDTEGVERLRLSADDHSGRLQARLDREEGHSDAIELYAAEDPNGGPGDVGVMILRDGDVTSPPDATGSSE